MSESYNGWSNREPWLVNVWFNPESKQDVAFAKEQIEEAYGNLPDFIKDFCYVDSINWDELSAELDELDELDEEDEEDEEDDHDL